MKLPQLVNFNIQRGTAYSIATHLVLAVLVSMNFDFSTRFGFGGKKVEIEILEIENTPVEQAEQKPPEQGAPVVSEQPVAAVDEAKKPTPQTAAVDVVEQGGDPVGEKVLWLCGVGAPPMEERGGFAGPWNRTCTVPPESYFKGWEITRIEFTSGVIGVGKVQLNGTEQVKNFDANNCEKNSNVTRPASLLGYGANLGLDISKCDPNSCGKSNCWLYVTYYGKSNGTLVPPGLGKWERKTQDATGILALHLNSIVRAPAQASAAEVATPVTTKPCSSPEACTRIYLPEGPSRLVYLEGKSCEDFGAFTLEHRCRDVSQSGTCSYGDFGNAGELFACWIPNGQVKDQTKSPAHLLASKLQRAK